MHFTPYKKYIILVIIFPLLLLGCFFYFNQYDFIFHIQIFVFFFIALILHALAISVKCPKCKQRIGCNEKSCVDFFGLIKLKGIFTTKCKKCGFNLNSKNTEKPT